MMERHKEHADDDALIGAFAKRAARQSRSLSSGQLDDGWQSLQSSLAASAPKPQHASPRSAQIRPWLLVLASATAATSLTLVGTHMLPWWAKPAFQPLASSRMLAPPAEPALRYTAENLVKSSDNSFTPSPQEGSCLLFSDGSRFAQALPQTDKEPTKVEPVAAELPGPPSVVADPSPSVSEVPEESRAKAAHGHTRSGATAIRHTSSHPKRKHLRRE